MKQNFSGYNFRAHFPISTFLNKFYSTLSDPVTRNLDDPANDFSILQALGCDPKHVTIHKKIIKENQGL